jgi:hypothetical protein
MFAHITYLKNYNEFNKIVSGETSNILEKFNVFNGSIAEKTKYKLISYDKELLNESNIHTAGLFRSVIMDNDAKYIMSFSPSKSLSVELFCEYINIHKTQIPTHNSDSVTSVTANIFDTIVPDKIIAEEFVEGTMINLFFDMHVGEFGTWVISTKHYVGGSNYVKQPINDDDPENYTFKMMFEDAMKHINLTYDDLNKTHKYSFLLQHPKNRIVIPVTEPKIFIINVYDITDDYEVKSFDYNSIKSMPAWEDVNISYPTQYTNWDTFSDLVDLYITNDKNNCAGLVLKDKSMLYRCKILNALNLTIKNMIGNHTNLYDRFYSLMQSNSVDKYVYYYNEHSKLFNYYYNKLTDYFKTVYGKYVDCFITKKICMDEIKPQYKTSLYNAHQYYHNFLKPHKLYITPEIITRLLLTKYISLNQISLSQ